MAESTSTTEGAGGFRQIVWWGAIAATVLLFGVRCVILTTHYIDPDELQHLHISYSIARGEVPYRDFFDHHPPLFAYAMAPLLSDLGMRVDDGQRAVERGRVAMALLAAVNLALTYLIGRRSGGPLIGALAIFMLSLTPIFARKSIEVRPDNLCLTFLLIALAIAQKRALQLERGSTSPLDAATETAEVQMRWRAACAGGAAMLALWSTPKALFLAAGIFAAGWAAEGFGRESGRPWKWIFAFAAGAAAVVGVLLAALIFVCHVPPSELFRCVVDVPVHWPTRLTSRWLHFESTLRYHSVFVLLAVTGAILSAIKARRDAAWWLLAVPPVLHGMGLYRVPIPYEQFFLLALPWMAVLAAVALVAWSGLAIESEPREGMKLLRPIAVLSAFLVAQTTVWTPWRHDILAPNNRLQLGAVRDAMRLAGPDERVFAALLNFAFLRPHAYYYWCLDEHLIQIVGKPQLIADVNAMLDERPPKLFIFHPLFVTHFPAELWQRIEELYEKSDSPILLIRKEHFELD